MAVRTLGREGRELVKSGSTTTPKCNFIAIIIVRSYRVQDHNNREQYAFGFNFKGFLGVQLSSSKLPYLPTQR